MREMYLIKECSLTIVLKSVRRGGKKKGAGKLCEKYCRHCCVKAQNFGQDCE